MAGVRVHSVLWMFCWGLAEGSAAMNASLSVPKETDLPAEATPAPTPAAPMLAGTEGSGPSGGGPGLRGSALPAPALPAEVPLRPASQAAVMTASDMQAVLDRHNMYRCMHGVPLMVWNTAIAANAQAWAEATGGEMVHSSFEARSGVGGFWAVGENLAWGVIDAGAVDMWYGEIQLSDGGLVADFSPSTGHYTQVVWGESTSLGCGVAGWLLVCQYGPTGNVAGSFSSQVTPPILSSC